VTAPIHGDMRDPQEGRAIGVKKGEGPFAGMLLVVGVNPPRPGCARCTLELLPTRGTVLVDRALILRDTSTGLYRAICHCHDATDVVELGDHPDEADVLAAVAFKRGQ
jgi:hypothetical protein